MHADWIGPVQLRARGGAPKRLSGERLTITPRKAQFETKSYPLPLRRRRHGHVNTFCLVRSHCCVAGRYVESPCSVFEPRPHSRALAHPYNPPSSFIFQRYSLLAFIGIHLFTTDLIHCTCGFAYICTVHVSRCTPPPHAHGVLPATRYLPSRHTSTYLDIQMYPPAPQALNI